jgi:arginyl-tRNA synthetase
MIRAKIKAAVDACFRRGIAAGYWSAASAGKYAVELPKRQGQGDFSTNLAMVAAGVDKKNPRDLAAFLANMLAGESGLFERVEVAGPGFVNMFVAADVWRGLIPEILAAGSTFGRSDRGAGRRVMVEFVSANPTGPLSIGHGRQAILGDAIARLLAATGHRVHREYY